MKTAADCPTDYQVEFHPETGSKRPWEIFKSYASGSRIHVGSYSTEKAARKQQAAKIEFARSRGWMK